MADEVKPYSLEQRGERYCVLDADGTVLKCYDDEDDAQAYLAALNANVPDAGKGHRAMEYKSAPVEFKASGDKGIYEGYFSIFGNQDDGGDVMMVGAFAKTIAERAARIKVFFGHDWSKLIGPPPEVLEEDSKGLYAKGRLTLGSFWGKEAWELMKDGALREGSIGYETITSDWDQRGVRFLKEVKLYEISPVPLGMNPLTEVQAVKMFRAADEATLDLLLQSLTTNLKASTMDERYMSRIQRAHDIMADLGAKCAEPASSDAAADEAGVKPPTNTNGQGRAALSAPARAATMRAAAQALVQLQDQVRRSRRQ